MRWMQQGVLPGTVVSVMLLPLALQLWAGPQNPAFPHDQHEGLFPTCNACHDGVRQNQKDRYFTVTPQDCAKCHDGEALEEVVWEPRAPESLNLIFDHAQHVVDEAIDCSGCHGTGTNRMDIGRFKVEACMDCHEHAEHLAPETPCTECHLPLSAAPQMTAAQVAGLPMPPSHESGDFLSTHGGMANDNPELCATCHSRELCETCHLNAEQLPAIAGLAADARAAQAVSGRPGNWPAPSSHADPEWLSQHGNRDMNSCANCHAQESCAQCHGIILPDGAQDLPLAGSSTVQGVELPEAGPPEHVPGFATAHAAAAASGRISCMTCHTDAYCEDCHHAPIAPGFHGRNYMQHHSGDAYSRTSDCASCHSQEVFCRSCHIQMGLSPGVAADASYHDAAGGYWLIAHAQAARQSIDNCASCHQQNDCLKCHSAAGGWGINPHGPGFNAERAQDRNPSLCLQCHFELPSK